MKTKQRLDAELVARGLFDSGEKARRAVMAGVVTVNGQRAAKAGSPTSSDAVIEVATTERFVSRGGQKLEPALTAFGVEPDGKVCLDIGASTGGFTDCLLQHGATRVYAVDVGRGQLAWRLREDARVVCIEGLNARNLQPSDIAETPSLAVADVSFISLTLILPPAFALLAPGADMVVLIKPQFELSPEAVGRGGVVREQASRIRAREKIRSFVEASGKIWAGCMDSPLPGREGNVEFLAHIKL